MCVLRSFSCIQLSSTLWTQVPLSIGFPRQEYWSALPFPSPGNPPDPEMQPRSPALQADFFFFFYTICATRETQRIEYHTAKRVDNLQQHPMVWLNNWNIVFSGGLQAQKDEYLIVRCIYSINIKPGKFVPVHKNHERVQWGRIEVD